ncbi:MAG: aminotransferase class I/II-fold pyridoxal phosphate-dependent enzyme [Candidatus Heimdallarchaeota archaeon]|nr:aminotransferase class I/II-fold pyridoxal phosphate-dependent enzyme [Candidatus Heimdallarchaeota archaeon]
MKKDQNIRQSKTKINVKEFINDPFKGKTGFMPDEVPESISTRIGLNENLVFPKEIMDQLLLEVAKTIDPRVYPEDYSQSLCQLIAEQHDINPNQIVVGNGGDKIIDLVVRLTIKCGNSSVIIRPTYPMYEHATKVQGGTLTSLLLTPSPEFDLNPDYILSNITPGKDRLLFLCSPNNPTGNQFDRSKLETLIQEFPGIVALDETYAIFADYSMVASLDTYPNLIIMKSLSKFYGMAGMRVGYCLSSEIIASRMKELLPAFNVNIASQKLAQLVLHQTKVHQQMIDTIVQERERLYNEMQKISEITPYKSYTNFILFKTLKAPAQTINKKMIEKGVLLRNMSGMPHCDNTLRVTITTKENNDRFLKALKNVLEKEI